MSGEELRRPFRGSEAALRQFPGLGTPHVVVAAPAWIFHCFRVVFWSATVGFFTWLGSEGVGDHGLSHWLMGGALVLVSVALALPRSWVPLANLAADETGIRFVLDAKGESVRVPWDQVLSMEAGAIAGRSGSIQGITFRIRPTDPVARDRLRSSFLPWARGGDAEEIAFGVSANARPPEKVVAALETLQPVSRSSPRASSTPSS